MACVYVANHLLCAPATRATDDTDDCTFVAFLVHHRGDPLQYYGDFELGEALTKIIMVDLLDGHNLIHQVFNFFLILDLFLTFVTLFSQFSIFRCFCFNTLCYYSCQPRYQHMVTVSYIRTMKFIFQTVKM